MTLLSFKSSIDAARSAQRKGVNFLYVVPAIFLLTLLSAFPLFQLARMSFSDVGIKNITGSWTNVGFANFRLITADPDFKQILINTLLFVGIVTFLGLFLGFVAAVAFNDDKKSSDFLLAFMVFIWALPPIVNGSVWKFLLGGDGLINVMLQKANLINEPIPFLYDPKMALYSVAIVNCWAVIPFNALILKAAFKSVSKDILEASEIDGVTPLQQIRYIYFPASRPTLLVLTILTLVYGFRSFDFIYVMTYGGPGLATNTLPFLGFIKAFVQFKFSEGAAIALLSAIFTSSLAFLYSRSVRKEEEND
jgi:multiple sugar transport system permease protein